MNDDGRIWCHFHPTEMVVGVCALCLNDRLLVLASNQLLSSSTNTHCSVPTKRVLPNLFHFTTFFTGLDIKPPNEVYYHHHHHHSTSSPTTPEDSFISMKFEENGVASWDKEKISNMSHDCEVSCKRIGRLVEHAKPLSLRWRKRIGNFFHLVRWKRPSSKTNMVQVEAGKAKYGWIRTLTKRRTKE